MDRRRFPLPAKVGLAGLLVLVVLPAAAQSFPRNEQYVGWAVSKSEPGLDSHVISKRGLSIGTTRNFSSFLGFTTHSTMQYDFGDRSLGIFPAWRGGELMMGPQLNLRRGRWIVFGRTMGGLSHQRMDSFALTPNECAQRRLDCAAIGGVVQPDGSFQFGANSAVKAGTALGFGVDYQLNERGAFRLFQADYLRLRSVDPTTTWRKQWRIEIGLVAWF